MVDDDPLPSSAASLAPKLRAQWDMLQKIGCEIQDLTFNLESTLKSKFDTDSHVVGGDADTNVWEKN